MCMQILCTVEFEELLLQWIRAVWFKFPLISFILTSQLILQVLPYAHSLLGGQTT